MALWCEETKQRTRNSYFSKEKITEAKTEDSASISKELGSQSHPPPIYPADIRTSASLTDTTKSPNVPVDSDVQSVNIQRRLCLHESRGADSELHMIGSHLESDQQPSLTRELRLVQSPGEMLTGSSISSEVSSGICDEGTIAGAQGDSSILLDEGGKDGKTGDEKDEVCEKPVVGVPITVDHSSLEDPVKAMDELLKECFLQALKTNMGKTELPLLTSTFYSAHMLPLCPTHLRLDIKRSSHKKLSRFLCMMMRSGIVKVEETGKGVESITSVDYKHPLIKEFCPSLLVGADKSGCSSSATVSPAARSTKPVIRVIELYMSSHKLLPVFSGCGHSKSSLLTASQVREVVTTYVKTNKLVSAQNSRLVVLDPLLCDALFKKGQALPEQLTWANLMERVLESMKPAFSITDGLSQPVIRKGQLQPVQMTVVQRTGNKKVTLVDNLDLYGIPPEQLARTVQRIAATSTSVTSIAGKTGGEQVLVQGNATKAIAKVLQSEYGLPLKYIEAVDKVKPPKKKSGQK